MPRALPLLLLLATACRPPKPVERPYAAPKLEDAMAALRAHAEHLTSLRDLSTRVEIQRPGEHGKMSVKMLIARGGRWRFEASAPVVGDVAALASDGQLFAMNDLRSHKFLQGSAKCALAQLLGIDLESNEASAVLLGGAPGLDGKPASIDWDPTHGGREVVTLDEPDGGHEKLFLDGRDGKWDLLAADRTDAAGKVVWHVDHDDWHDVGGGIRLPRRTHLAQPPTKTEATIRWKDQEPNVDAPPGVFTLPPPPGVTVETVTC